MQSIIFSKKFHLKTSESRKQKQDQIIQSFINHTNSTITIDSEGKFKFT